MIWSIQSFTKMSKGQILNEIYPDEIPIIYEKMRDNEREKIVQAINLFYSAAYPHLKDSKPVDDYLDSLKEQLNKLSAWEDGPETAEEVEEEIDPEEKYNKAIDQLKGAMEKVQKED